MANARDKRTILGKRRTTTSTSGSGRLREQFGQVKMHEEDGNVDMYPCKNQVIITVNAPPCFKLSLDFLPCFQQKPPLPEDQAGLPLMKNSPEKGGWIAGSSNGILLCTTGKFLQTHYYLCNPLTKQWIPLPPAPRTYTVAHIGFVFDPCSVYCQQKLHCSACRFMLVRFDDNVGFEVETFSSETNQWTIATAAVPSKKPFCWAKDPLTLGAIFYRKCFHWYTRSCRIVVYDPYIRAFLGLLCGPLSDDEFREDDDLGGLGLSQGSFWLCHYGRYSLDMCLWKLNGYDSNECYWSLQYKMNLTDTNRSFKLGQSYIFGSPIFGPMLDIHPHDPDIIYMQLSIGWKFYVVSCNLRTRTLGQLRLRRNDLRFPGDVFTMVFPVPNKATTVVGSSTSKLSISPV